MKIHIYSGSHWSRVKLGKKLYINLGRFQVIVRLP